MRSSPRGLFQQLSVGGHHTCGLRREGTAVCWGDDLAGCTSGAPEDTIFVQVPQSVHLQLLEWGQTNTASLLFDTFNAESTFVGGPSDQN